MRPLLTVLLLLTLASPAQAIEFGAQEDWALLHASSAERERALDLMQNLGATQVRVMVTPSTLPEAPRAARAIRARGMRVLVTLWDDWGRCDLRDRGTFDRFAIESIRALRGYSEWYSPYNEPDLFCFPSRAASDRQLDISRADRYRPYLQHFIELVRALDPGAEVVAGDVSPIDPAGEGGVSFLARLFCLKDPLPDCRPPQVDAIAAHPYQFEAAPQLPGSPANDGIGDTPTYVSLAKLAASALGRPSMPIDYTEFGYPASSSQASDPPPDGSPAALSAQWWPQAFSLARSSGIRSISLYHLLPDSFDTSVVSLPDWTPRPVYWSLRDCVRFRRCGRQTAARPKPALALLQRADRSATARRGGAVAGQRSRRRGEPLRRAGPARAQAPRSCRRPSLQSRPQLPTAGPAPLGRGQPRCGPLTSPPASAPEPSPSPADAPPNRLGARPRQRDSSSAGTATAGVASRAPARAQTAADLDRCVAESNERPQPQQKLANPIASPPPAAGARRCLIQRCRRRGDSRRVELAVGERITLQLASALTAPELHEQLVAIVELARLLRNMLAQEQPGSRTGRTARTHSDQATCAHEQPIAALSDPPPKR